MCAIINTVEDKSSRQTAITVLINQYEIPSTEWVSFQMTGAIKRIKNNKSQQPCYFAVSIYTLQILFLAGRDCGVRKKERRDATAKFRQAKSRRSCIARGAATPRAVSRSIYDAIRYHGARN